MIGPAKLRPVNENGTDRVEDQRNPAIRKFHSPRPPPEKPRTKQSKQRRDKRSGEIDRLRREWFQRKREAENEIVERRGGVGRGTLREILECMIPHDQSRR